MATSLVPYFVAGTLLFFFWAYGIVSFVLDVKNKFIPAIQGYRQLKEERKEEREAEEEREEKKKQLY
ncbi:MAG: hypothetical protein ABEJ47_05355 [Halorhabdus sp.]